MKKKDLEKLTNKTGETAPKNEPVVKYILFLFICTKKSAQSLKGLNFLI